MYAAGAAAPHTGFGQAASLCRRAITWTCNCGTRFPSTAMLSFSHSVVDLSARAAAAISPSSWICTFSSRSVRPNLAAAAPGSARENWRRSPAARATMRGRRQEPCPVRAANATTTASEYLKPLDNSARFFRRKASRAAVRWLAFRPRWPDIGTGGWRWTSHSPTG
jgi:hypothetical protein